MAVTLTAGNIAALKARQVRIEPILEVSPDGGASWSTVPPSTLVGRPVRASSPVLSRTPVMRCDIEIAPTATIKALVLQGRFVRYTEVINGQTFVRFVGNLGKPEKGMAVHDGAVVESLRVTALSRSQQLADLDYERINLAATTGPSSTQCVAMTMLNTPADEMVIKAATGDDILRARQMFQPNLTPYQATVTLENGTTYLAGVSTFYIVINVATNELAVHWNAALTTGTRYKLTYFKLAGLVVPASPSYWTTTSATAAASGVFDMDPANQCEMAPEMVTQARLPRQSKLSRSRSHPTFFLRAGSASGVATEVTRAEEWTANWDQGYFLATPPTGFSGSPVRMYATTQFVSTDILLVGATGFTWPDPANLQNTLDYALSTLYGAAGVGNDFDPTNPAPRVTGIALADYRIQSKGDEALRTLLANAPPNWLVYDAPDGYARGRYITQSGTAALTLTQTKALRDVALSNSGQNAQTNYTMVRVRSTFQSSYLVQNWGQTMVFGDFPGLDKTAWSDFFDIFMDNATASSGPTLAGGTTTYMVFSSLQDSNRLERVKSIELDMEGEIRVFRTTGFDPYTASPYAIPPEANREYLNGYERVNTPSGFSSSITIPVDQMSGYGEGGRYPEVIWVEFRGCARANTCKVYRMYVTLERVILGVACLTDETISGAALGQWATQTLHFPIGSPPVTDGYMRLRAKRVTYDGLQSMISPNSAITSGFDFYWNWPKHRVLTIDNLPSLSIDGANAIAQAYLDDNLRRATAQEGEYLTAMDPIAGLAAEIGDTVATIDASGSTLLRTVVGFRDGASFEDPSITLELADFT